MPAEMFAGKTALINQVVPTKKMQAPQALW
jgi:hypothetical protein